MGNFDAYNPNFNYGGNSVQNIGMPRPMQTQPIDNAKLLYANPSKGRG